MSGITFRLPFPLLLQPRRIFPSMCLELLSSIQSVPHFLSFLTCLWVLGFMSPLCFFFLTMLCLFLLANTACEQQRPLTPCSKVLICCCKNSLLVKGFTDVSTKSFQQILNLLSTSRLRKSTERLTFTKHSKARGTVQKVFI